MKIRILGKYSPFPAAGGACPGYWVHTERTGLLLECGPGVLSRFARYASLSAISAVILSHLHADHFSDFLCLRYAAEASRRNPELPGHVVVWAPSGPEDVRGSLRFKDVVTVNTISAGEDIEVGDLKISFFPVEHPVPCYAVRITHGRSVLAYSGDTRPCDALRDAARGADLFLCEASCLERDAAYAAAGHLTPGQAARAAADASVKRLLLTHIWPFYSEEEILAEAREVFSRAEVAQEGAEYEV